MSEQVSGLLFILAAAVFGLLGLSLLFGVVPHFWKGNTKNWETEQRGKPRW